MRRNENESSNLLARIIIVCAGLIIGFAVCRVFIIPFSMSDSSMGGSAPKGSKMLILRFGELKIGGIVLARHPNDNGKFLLKRIAAASGDIVEIRNKVLYVNNRKSDLNAHGEFSDERNLPLMFTDRDTMTAVKLEKDEYFLLGDNRDRSYDSRELGIFTKSMIKGKVFYMFK